MIYDTASRSVFRDALRTEADAKRLFLKNLPGRFLNKLSWLIFKLQLIFLMKTLSSNFF